MLRDTRRVDLSGKSVVRAKFQGNRFELIVNPELALKYKMGLLDESITIDDILEVDEIFDNASKGERASDEILNHCFETTNIIEIAEKILVKGDLNLTAEQRQEFFEKKRKQIVNLLAKTCINPKTRTPHPPLRIENAMKEAKVMIDPTKSAEEQIKDIIVELRTIIPISMETVKLAVQIPPEFTGKAYGEIKRKGQIEKDEWQKDGSWIAVVSIAAGVQGEFMEMVQGMTKGRSEIKVIERIRL
ncbi:ribosome assembly factor SBDS [Candidatus Heimdallarchaeota archaeon B3_Heim]|nr:MAG: ribosome assembly factor SBDS [Candidatus Heimdallarchaeota archaeon B3_Heim]